MSSSARCDTTVDGTCGVGRRMCENESVKGVRIRPTEHGVPVGWRGRESLLRRPVEEPKSRAGRRTS